MKTFLHSCALLCALSFALTMSIFAQGSLAPPGPPAPTMKTLDQVEARIIVNATNTPGDAANTFVINAPGSYYLTGNITGASGKHGISIRANDVTLDLNGFALISGGGGAFRGINVPAAQTNFSVRNGSVRGWTDGGVRADAAVTLAEKLRLSNNSGALGLAVGNGSMIKDCVASGNGTGFRALDWTQVTTCISTVNTGVGFDCTSFVTLVDCTSSRNGGDGIVVQGSSTVMRCNASRNIPSGNGITAGADCSISGCTAGSNGNDGILATSRCHLTGNTCDGNTNAGIHTPRLAGAGENRIDGNSCSSNKFGFLTEGNSDLLIRNSSCCNSTKERRCDNSTTFGPFVFVPAGGEIRETSPWANFIQQSQPQ